ncbi:MAG: helix-turn-helix domain-containing protein [Fischerella sp. CENA71]|nr:helix-turn-helix domain-containing protein [Fischerella sp. CENA71]
MADMLMVGESTVHRTRQRYLEEGVELALNERSRKGRDKKLAPETEAFLIATACSTPPTGRESWTMQLLADRLVSLELIKLKLMDWRFAASDARVKFQRFYPDLHLS